MAVIKKGFVDKLPNQSKKTIFYFDDELKGFGLRCSGETKTYIVQAYVARPDGTRKKVRHKLGRHGVLTAEEARKQAKAVLLQMAGGVDPNAAKRSRTQSEITLRQLFDEYRNARTADGGLRDKTVDVYRGALERCFPDWLDRPAALITKEMVVERYRDIATTEGARSNSGGARAQASQSMRVLRALMNYAKDVYEDAEGASLFSSNPVDRLSKLHRGWSRVPARSDVIEPADLAAWYQGLQALKSNTARDFMLVCLFTGLRRSAALKLKWSNVNFKSKTVTIPASDDKTHKAQKLPLSNEVLLLLEQRKASPTVDLIYVFPGDKPGTHLQEPKSAVNAVKSKSGVYFSMHTLRRTFATTAERLDISYYKVKMLLNHAVSGDVTGHHYVQVDVEQLREPVQQIANYLTEKMGVVNVGVVNVSGIASGARKI